MIENDEPRAAEVLRRLARRVPRYIRLALRLARDRKVSPRQKAPLLAAVGYGISPIDLVPGFIPVVGQLDDLLVLLGALRYTLSQVRPEVATRHLFEVGLTRQEIDDDFDDVIRLSKRLGVAGARTTAGAAWGGAKFAGRMAGRGLSTLLRRPRATT